MIGHRKRFIFVHIPKTAGTSLSKVLSRHGTFLQGKRNQKSIYFKHAIAKDLEPMFGDEFARYYKFSFVRNPWDWVISNYEHNRGMHHPIIRGTNYPTATFRRLPEELKRMPFDEWLDWWLEAFHPEQSKALEDERGSILVDEIFYFEELAESIRRITKNLGIWRFKKLPHVHRNERRKERLSDYYDPPRKEKVRRYMARDIKNFSYEYPE